MNNLLERVTTLIPVRSNILEQMIELDNKPTLTLDEAIMFFNHISSSYEVARLPNDSYYIKVPNEVLEICKAKLINITEKIETYNKRTKITLSVKG